MNKIKNTPKGGVFLSLFNLIIGFQGFRRRIGRVGRTVYVILFLGIIGLDQHRHNYLRIIVGRGANEESVIILAVTSLRGSGLAANGNRKAIHVI